MFKRMYNFHNIKKNENKLDSVLITLRSVFIICFISCIHSLHIHYALFQDLIFLIFWWNNFFMSCYTSTNWYILTFRSQNNLQKCAFKYQELPCMLWNCKASSEVHRVTLIHCWSQWKFCPGFQLMKYVSYSFPFQCNGDWLCKFRSGGVFNISTR